MPANQSIHLRRAAGRLNRMVVLQIRSRNAWCG
jgi:hypothetical protein